MPLGCLDERPGVAIVSTAGAGHEAPVLEPVFEQRPDAQELAPGVMAQGDDRDKSRKKRRAEAIEPVMPPQSHRKEPDGYHQALDKLRPTVERCMKRVQPFRRIATRDEKLAITFLSLIHLVAVYVAMHGCRTSTFFDSSRGKRRVGAIRAS